MEYPELDAYLHILHLIDSLSLEQRDDHVLGSFCDAEDVHSLYRYLRSIKELFLLNDVVPEPA
jgi:hypothetical protein